MDNLKMLCVDDQCAIRTLLKEIFEKDYIVKTVSSGKEAIKEAKEFKPHIAIVDMKLNNMKGTEVINKLKELDPDIRSIILTGYGEERTEEIMKSNVEMILKKPFDVNEIKSIINKLMKTAEA
ncbi:MAG: response regulator [Firmicutes bacterium]|nr:response regulator [Bacillota bacterium]